MIARRLPALLVIATLTVCGWQALVATMDHLHLYEIEEPHGAQRITIRSWNLGPTPTVVVDCFEGDIEVIPGDDALVTAKVTSTAQAETVRSAASQGLASIQVSFAQQGDVLRVIARGASEPSVRKDVHVELSVPARIRLDLRTGRGGIYVGQVGWDRQGKNPLARPITAYSIRARNDSKCRLGPAEGNIFIAAAAPHGADDSIAATRLQLDACGRIDVVAEQAIVEAHAWHGSPAPELVSTYEDGREGSISFDGTFARGTHTLRAAHGLELKMPATAAVEVDAEATRGSITGNIVPDPVHPLGEKARWSGTQGLAPTANLRLRTDRGSIQLNKNPQI